MGNHHPPLAREGDPASFGIHENLEGIPFMARKFDSSFSISDIPVRGECS